MYMKRFNKHNVSAFLHSLIQITFFTWSEKYVWHFLFLSFLLLLFWHKLVNFIYIVYLIFILRLIGVLQINQKGHTCFGFSFLQISIHFTLVKLCYFTNNTWILSLYMAEIVFKSHFYRCLSLLCSVKCLFSVQ